MTRLSLTLAALLVAGPALAQTTTMPNAAPPSAPMQGQGAAVRPNTDNITGSTNLNVADLAKVKLEEGANSFTEGQVRSRLEAAGFANVADLKKDDKGIWRGSAMHQSKKFTVGFDYKGNVQAQ